MDSSLKNILVAEQLVIVRMQVFDLLDLICDELLLIQSLSINLIYQVLLYLFLEA